MHAMAIEVRRLYNERRPFSKLEAGYVDDELWAACWAEVLAR